MALGREHRYERSSAGMAPPDALKVDYSKPDNVVKEIFDSDGWIKDKFAQHVSEDLTKLSERLAAAFAAFAKLDAIVGQDEQKALVAGFVFGVIDDILVSTKILVAGKLMPSGNLMRQAIEGIAVAALCADKGLLTVKARGNQSTQVRYWERVKDGDRLVESHKALAHLALNRVTLGVSEQAVERLQRARARYHQFSHPGVLAIAAGVSLGPEGQVYAGGHFDEEKVGGYKIELQERAGLCGILPALIDSLIARLST